jgi:hypothetical protein
MKILLLSIVSVFFLTGCPEQEEINNMLEGLAEKKSVAQQNLQKKDYSLPSLLSMQDYFFDFSEKVHLLKTEPDAQKSLNYLIKQNGLQSVCGSFVLPLSQWQVLNKYCTTGSYYRCSPEIRDYKSTLELFKTFVGLSAQDPTCG